MKLLITFFIFMANCCVSAQTFPRAFDVLSKDDQAYADAHLPAISLEKHHSGHPETSSYRVDIYPGGRIRYIGISHVKRLGEIITAVPVADVQRLLDKVEKIGVWDISSFPKQSNEIFPSPLVFEFYVRKGAYQRRLLLTYTSQAAEIYFAVESVMSTVELRCPYLSRTAIDACKGEEEDYRELLNKKTGE